MMTHMRMMLATLLLLMCGCTSLRLERSITSQATTLSDLHYNQVLNNLAAFSANPETIPSHVTIRDGSAQIQDFGSASGGLEILHDVTTSLGLTGSRTVVEQWGVSPVTDDIEIRLIQVAYKRAHGQPVLMDSELANDIGRQLGKQTAETSDIDQRNEFASYNRYRDRVIDNCVTTLCAEVKDVESYRASLTEVSRLDAAALEDIVGTNNDDIVAEGEDMTSLSPFARVNRKADGSIDRTILFTPLAAYARKELKDIQKDMTEIGTGWFHVGGRRDVPRNACYVGRANSCGRECYVWVCPDGLAELSKFTIKIMKFSSLIKESSLVTIPGGGPRFTPGGSGGR